MCNRTVVMFYHLRVDVTMVTVIVLPEVAREYIVPVRRLMEHIILLVFFLSKLGAFYLYRSILSSIFNRF